LPDTAIEVVPKNITQIETFGISNKNSIYWKEVIEILHGRFFNDGEYLNIEEKNCLF